MTVSLRRILTGEGKYKPIDWREFHFFKSTEGVKKSDLQEIRICLDYEQARESTDVQKFVAGMSDRGAQAGAIKRAIERRSRYLSIGWEGGEAEQKEAEGLFVPSVCAAASWFPLPWLSANKESRRRVIAILEPIYSSRPLPSWAFPMDTEEAQLITMAAQDDGSMLRVVVIDKSQTVTKLVDQFRELLRNVGMRGDDSRRGKVKVASALEDLGCYRLSRLQHRLRSDAMVEAGFIRSANKISAAKKRAAARLLRLNYIPK